MCFFSTSHIVRGAIIGTYRLRVLHAHVYWLLYISIHLFISLDSFGSIVHKEPDWKGHLPCATSEGFFILLSYPRRSTVYCKLHAITNQMCLCFNLGFWTLCVTCLPVSDFWQLTSSHCQSIWHASYCQPYLHACIPDKLMNKTFSEIAHFWHYLASKEKPVSYMYVSVKKRNFWPGVYMS